MEGRTGDSAPGISGRKTKLVSACLLGLRCTWNDGDNYSNRVIEAGGRDILIPVCPEQLGGLPTPRAPQEIQGGNGEDVLDGRTRVHNRHGDDTTGEFIRGAEATLSIALLTGAGEFIAKARSPSCGSGQVYDGSFSGKLVPGDGVTTALLRRHGIRIVTEEEL